MVPGARAWRPPPAAAEDRNWINFANVTIEEGWRPPSTAAENCRPAGAGHGGGRRLRSGRAAAERGDLEGLRARPTPGDDGLPTLIYPRKRHIFWDKKGQEIRRTEPLTPAEAAAIISERSPRAAPGHPPYFAVQPSGLAHDCSPRARRLSRAARPKPHEPLERAGPGGRRGCLGAR